MFNLKNILITVATVAIVAIVAVGLVGNHQSNKFGSTSTTNLPSLGVALLEVGSGCGDAYTSCTGTKISSAGLNSIMPITASVTGTTTLTAAQTGTTFAISTSSTVLVLPAVASSAGVQYRFVVASTTITASSTIMSAEGDNIEGSMIVAGAVVDCNANDIVTVGDIAENVGDFIDLYSNGTYWLIGASGVLTSGEFSCSG